MDTTVWHASPHWSTFWGQLQIEIIGGTISALLFLFIVLLLFKPKIRISPFLCKTKSQFDGEKTVYFVKVVNVSIFAAYEVKVELYVLEKYPTPPTGMMNTRMRELALISNFQSDLAPYRPKWMRKEANHCIRFRTVEDLDEIIANEFKSVQILVTLKHGVTGLVKVFSQEYSDENEVKEGKFTYGTRFGVIQ